MRAIEEKLINAWNNNKECKFGKGSNLQYRDVITIDSNGNKHYYLWGTELVRKEVNRNLFFLVTSKGSEWDCLSLTSMNRINAFLKTVEKSCYIKQKQFKNVLCIEGKEYPLQMNKWYCCNYDFNSLK